MNPYILLVLAPLFWSGNWLIGRGLHETVTPVGLNFWRWTVAFTVLLVIVSPTLRTRWPIYIRHWKVLCLLGFLGIGVFQIMVYIGLKHTSAINAVVLNSTMPIFMVITSWLCLRETITWRQAFGGLVSFAGIFTIVSGGSLASLLGIEFSLGDLVIVAAMPIWAAYSVILKRSDTGLTGIETLAGMTAPALAMMAPIYAVDVLFYGNQVPVTYSTSAAILYIGVFSSVGAFYCWNEGVRGAGSNIAGFMYHLLPAFGTIGAVALLGEQLFAYQVAGIALILTGVYMSTRTGALPR